jgi:hypothetical protein
MVSKWAAASFSRSDCSGSGVERFTGSLRFSACAGGRRNLFIIDPNLSLVWGRNPLWVETFLGWSWVETRIISTSPGTGRCQRPAVSISKHSPSSISPAPGIEMPRPAHAQLEPLEHVQHHALQVPDVVIGTEHFRRSAPGPSAGEEELLGDRTGAFAACMRVADQVEEWS